MRLLNYISDFRSWFCDRVASWLLGRSQDRIFDHPETFDSFRILAAQRLEEQIPFLYKGEDSPSVTRGIFSWQKDFSEGEIPVLDVVFLNQRLIFCLYPRKSHETNCLSIKKSANADGDSKNLSSSEVLGPGGEISLLERRRRSLELLFRNHLLKSDDPLPLLPIFCDPRELLACGSLEDFALFIEESWQESLSWAKRQCPPLSPNMKTAQAGSWLQRRLWIEDVSQYSLLKPNK